MSENDTPRGRAAVGDAIPVLWFDREISGPDELWLALHLHPFLSEMDGKIPASLCIRVRAGKMVIGAGALVDGWFMLHRDQVAEMHRQFGEWLAQQRESKESP